jgi:arsenate reductase-like glutaredoxin family protein
VSCQKARAALDQGGIKVDTEVDARKTVLQGDAAWQLVAGADRIVVAIGKKIKEFIPAEATKEEILAGITGRTGNLRAPALRRGGTFYIGYNDALYALIAS